MGSVLMTKGQTFSLNKTARDAGVTNLQTLVVACGWDEKKPAKKQKKFGGLFGGLLGDGSDAGSEEKYDLDLSAACLGSDRKVSDHNDPTDADVVPRQDGFVWANHHSPQLRYIDFGGDNRTGKGDGDDETMTVHLSKVPTDEIVAIKFAAVVWGSELPERFGQTFGEIENAFIRAYDKDTGLEIVRYNLTEEFSDETLVAFGELYWHNGEPKFRALGEGYDPTRYQQEHNIRTPFHIECARDNY